MTPDQRDFVAEYTGARRFRRLFVGCLLAVGIPVALVVIGLLAGGAS